MSNPYDKFWLLPPLTLIGAFFAALIGVAYESTNYGEWVEQQRIQLVNIASSRQDLKPGDIIQNNSMDCQMRPGACMMARILQIPSDKACGIIFVSSSIDQIADGMPASGNISGAKGHISANPNLLSYCPRGNQYGYLTELPYSLSVTHSLVV